MLIYILFLLLQKENKINFKVLLIILVKCLWPLLNSKFRSVHFSFEISIVMRIFQMEIRVEKKKHFKRITFIRCSENVSSRESFHRYYNIFVKTFCMAQGSSHCILETDNWLQLMWDMNKELTRKIEQCYNISLLMQLEKRYSLGIKCSKEI